MPVTAKLKLLLTANDVPVAESEDPSLWESVFQAISAGAPSLLPPKSAQSRPPVSHPDETPGVDASVARLATEFGVESTVLVGACSPSRDAPYISLDHRHWEALKGNLPPRGPGSLGPVAVALTLLALWQRHAKTPQPTVGQGQAVLDTISLRDANAARSIKNCEWLQHRDTKIIVNPALVSKAIALARTYCTKKASQVPSVAE